MSGLARDMDVDLVLARRLVTHDARMTVRVEREAHVRVQQAAVEMLRAMHAVLLGHCEYDLQRAVRNRVLAQLAQRLQDGRDARLVIRAENRRAIRADDAILDDRVDTRTGLHAVHMRRQHDRRQGFKPICSREVRDEIATVAADCLTGLVLAHRAAELLQALRQQVTNLPLVMRRTRNGNELQKLREHALSIDHIFISHRKNLLYKTYTSIITEASAQWQRPGTAVHCASTPRSG